MSLFSKINKTVEEVNEYPRLMQGDCNPGLIVSVPKAAQGGLYKQVTVLTDQFPQYKIGQIVTNWGARRLRPFKGSVELTQD